jgi:hypothetical protein
MRYLGYARSTRLPPRRLLPPTGLQVGLQPDATTRTPEAMPTSPLA